MLRAVSLPNGESRTVSPSTLLRAVSLSNGESRTVSPSNGKPAFTGLSAFDHGRTSIVRKNSFALSERFFLISSNRCA